ncbi:MULTISPECIES: hypothetical protein [unclassified Sphingopyxis]|uniref:hypothetical protein n=1 Tax=unclassified Sphingopyxis TaxID=2614943 RepID=UPI002861A391|nr:MULTISPECIES: hypothetical protein [unclassified Sphingopyxis]MDR6833184.1 hypothetical protein [Sphingopyxis sp. BE122]MDR7228927.1 hypothetical protein [Sphingopyxis sp. BE259]
MLDIVLFVVAAAATDPAADRTPPDRPPSTMTSTEIKAHNEGLATAHPYYVRCRKIEELGSLVKKARVCHTNEQWKKLWAQGNQDSRDTLEAMTRAPVNHSN